MRIFCFQDHVFWQQLVEKGAMDEAEGGHMKPTFIQVSLELLSRLEKTFLKQSFVKKIQKDCCSKKIE